MPPQDNAQGDYTFYDNKGNVYSVKGLRVSTGGAAHPATEEEAKRHLASNGIIDIFSAREKVDKLAQQVGVTDKPDSIPGGFARRAASTRESILPIGRPDEMLAESGLNPINALINLVRADKKLGPQAWKQIKSADPRAIYSVPSLAVPYASQTAADVNELTDEGRYNEATGTALFDLLMLGSSAKVGGEKVVDTFKELRNPLSNFKLRGKPTPKGVNVDRLAHATGAELYKHGEELRGIAPDLEAGAKQSSRPKTIQQLRQLVTDVKSRLDSQFNQLLQPLRGRQVIPIDIANELNAEAQKPNLQMTAEGRQAAKELRRRAIEFSRPWKLEALNEERMRVSAQRQSFYNKSQEAQGAKLRSSVDEKIDSIIERGLKDLVYGEMERANPSVDISSLKRRQSQLMTIESDLKDRIRTVESAQMSQRGRLLREKLSPSAYGRPQSGSVGVHVHGLQRLLPDSFGGPEGVANAATRKAFPSQSVAAKAGRAAKRGAALAAPLAPKDRRKALEAQLAVAERVDKRWAARLRKKLQEEQ